MAKKTYIGAPTEVPAYATKDVTEVITSDNVGSWFTFSDPDGISSWSGTTLTVSGVYSNERVKLTALYDMTVSFDYTTTSYCKVNFNSAYINDDGDDGSYTGTLPAGKSMYFYISNSTTTRTGTFTNITCTRPMLVESGTQIKSMARKVKKGYFGIDSLAHRIRKAYIGVGGVARPVWTGELTYWGTAKQPLDVKEYDAVAASTKTHAIIAGGAVSSNVYSYNKSLTKEEVTVTMPLQNTAAASINGCAVFGGGHNSAGTAKDTVYAFDENKTMSTLTSLMTARYNLSAVSNGLFLLFGGGRNSGGTNYNTVDIYLPNLTKRIDITLTLRASTNNCAATTQGTNMLFAGGNSATVTGFTDTLTRVDTVPALTSSRSELPAASVGEYAIFGGGYTTGSGSATSTPREFDIYGPSFTKVLTTSIWSTDEAGATSLGEYAIFAGGKNGSNNRNDVIVFNNALERVQGIHALSEARSSLAATTIGYYAIFAGGQVSGGGGTKAVDVYTI